MNLKIDARREGLMAVNYNYVYFSYFSYFIPLVCRNLSGWLWLLLLSREIMGLIWIKADAFNTLCQELVLEWFSGVRKYNIIYLFNEYYNFNNNIFEILGLEKVPHKILAMLKTTLDDFSSSFNLLRMNKKRFNWA